MNTQHKLTAQMVAAYPNAQVMYRTDLGGKGVIGNLQWLYFRRDELVASIENSFMDMQDDCANFQLVLTSPDKITDAQALKVAKEFFIEEWQTLEKSKAIFSNLDYDDDWNLDSATKFTDICRSLNIDMGYKNIPSLIAVGLAVEKEVSHE